MFKIHILKALLGLYFQCILNFLDDFQSMMKLLPKDVRIAILEYLKEIQEKKAKADI